MYLESERFVKLPHNLTKKEKEDIKKVQEQIAESVKEAAAMDTMEAIMEAEMSERITFKELHTPMDF